MLRFNNIAFQAILFCCCFVVQSSMLANEQPPIPWVVKAPSTPIALDPHQPAIPIAIVVGSKTLSDIDVANVDLYEQSRHYPLFAWGTRLCTQGTGTCQKVRGPVSSHQTVWLRPAQDATTDLLAGHYKGTVVLAATTTGDPINETVAVEAFVTTDGSIARGTAFVLAGVVIAFLGTTFGRTRFNRGVLLLPVAVLREKLQAMRRYLAVSLSAHLDQTQTTRRVLEEQLGKLSEETLENRHFIPRALSPAWSVQTTDTDKLQKYLDEVEAKYELLRTVVYDGMAIACSTPDVQEAALDAVMKKLDSLSNQQSDLAAARNAIEAALKALAVAVAPPGGAAAPETADRIRIELQHISILSWIVLTIVTTVVGVYVIVAGNLGFGIWTDYLQCFLWGLGLPTGAAALQQLTAQTAGNAVGYSIQKS